MIRRSSLPCWTSSTPECLGQASLRDNGGDAGLKLGATEKREAHLLLALGVARDLRHPELKTSEITAAFQERVIQVGDIARNAFAGRTRQLPRRVFGRAQELLRNRVRLIRDGPRTLALRRAKEIVPVVEAAGVRQPAEQTAVIVEHHRHFGPACGCSAEEAGHIRSELRRE